MCECDLQLTGLPVLSLVPLLEVLDVSGNEITGSLKVLGSGDNRLRVLSLRNNKLHFETAEVFIEELGVLRNHVNLCVFSMSSSSLSNLTNIRELIISTLPNLEV